MERNRKAVKKASVSTTGNKPPVVETYDVPDKIKQRIDALNERLQRTVAELNRAAEEVAMIYLESQDIPIGPGDTIAFNEQRHLVITRG